MKTLLSLLLLTTMVASAQSAVQRPLIWVTPADRDGILAKIESQAWAKSSFGQLKAGVREAVAQHRENPEAFLRRIPAIPSPAGSGAHPTFAPIPGNMASTPNKGAGSKLGSYLRTGVDCGVLYYLTGDEDYARCGADILHVFVEAIRQMKTDPNDSDGGLLYPNDFLYEARGIGDQIPLIYDFVHEYLKSGASVFDLGSGERKPFNFEHAQELFRSYAQFAIDGGIIDNNHPVFEMNCLAHNALALDDADERASTFEYLVSKDTPHQDSLNKVLKLYARPGDVWPESFQYSSSVSSRLVYLVALARRQNPPARLSANYANIPLSLARLSDFRFPSGENIRFGDSPRRGGGGSLQSCEIAYSLALWDGDEKLQELFGGILARGMADGKYNRTSSARGALPLLWYAPEINVPPAAASAPPRTTDELPFVGAVLQRNFSPDKKNDHALMAVVLGGSHVHGHASGMSLELFGSGRVLGTPAGKGTYTTDEHENYRRLFAAYNCVIVNGASRSEGDWVNLGISQVQPVVLEPAIGALPVSRNHSFTLTSFKDDKGPGAKARQERLVGIVRTSPTTGFYVDVFRSSSTLPNQFHDYLYHNIGDVPTLATASGELKLTPSPERYLPVANAKWERNRSYLFPGWHVFKDAKTSARMADDVTVDFGASKLTPAPLNMRLFIPGAAGREYSQSLAPATKDAPAPYNHAPTPVLVVRQHGEAWTHPFAVIYEPFAGDRNSGSIQNVTALGDEAGFAGLKVVSRINGQSLTKYVLVQPEVDSVFEDVKLGITFTGRYAVISVNDRDECTALYLGEGSRLRFQGYDLHAVAAGATAAFAEISGDTATVTALAPIELTLTSGRRVTFSPVALEAGENHSSSDPTTRN